MSFPFSVKTLISYLNHLAVSFRAGADTEYTSWEPVVLMSLCLSRINRELTWASPHVLFSLLFPVNATSYVYSSTFHWEILHFLFHYYYLTALDTSYFTNYAEINS